MGFSTVEGLQALFTAQGADTIYFKRLAPKQDNEKNQIYFGAGFDSLSGIFPASYHLRGPSESTAKRSSKTGQHKLEAALKFAWLSEDGVRHAAPDARIINYFQYPEIRFSGFLNRCDAPPDALRRRRQAEYGERILALGVAADETIVGVVLTGRDDRLVANFPALPLLPGSDVFSVLTVDAQAGASPRDLVNGAVRAIVAGNWHRSVILKGNRTEPFRGSQGGGYTLEALLGIAANASKGPDKYGYEIKSYSGSRISLMTPTPDRGFQGEHTFREFMERYGRPAEKADGSIRFTGLHRCGAGPNNQTGLTLRVAGYDTESDSFSEDASEIAVELFNPVTNDVVAGWSLEKLANSWNGKHAFALYIRSEKNRRPGDPGQPAYRYLAPWLVGEGTDVWRMLRAVHRGLIYYDPAHTIYADGRAKVRPQWRVNTAGFEAAMRTLYAEVLSVD